MDKRNFNRCKINTLLFFVPLLTLWQLLSINNAFANTPKIYVGNSQDNTVSVIDSSTDKIIKTISLSGNPEGMAITLDDKFVYVGGTNTSSITLLDTRSDAAIYGIDAGASTKGFAIAPDGSELIAAVPANDNFVIIDTASNKLIGKIPLPAVTAITIDPAGEYGFANSESLKHYSLNEFTIATSAMLFPIPVPYPIREMSFSPDSKSIYFTVNGQDTLEVMNIFDKKITAEIPVGSSPFYITFTHDGKTGLVVSQGDNNLVLFDPKTNAIITKIKVGAAPYWIAVNADDSKVYVTNEESNSVSVVDLASKKVVDTISVGQGPHQLVMQRV